MMEQQLRFEIFEHSQIMIRGLSLSLSELRQPRSIMKWTYCN